MPYSPPPGIRGASPARASVDDVGRFVPPRPASAQRREPKVLFVVVLAILLWTPVAAILVPLVASYLSSLVFPL